MKILLLGLIACFAVLFVIFFIIWRHADWEKIEEDNKKFIDHDGNHTYYDRKIIRRNKGKR